MLQNLVPALAGIESVPNYLRIFIVLLPIFLFEPLLVTLTGGSPGHHLFKIKIRATSEDKKLPILKSIIRFVVKALLGFISLTLILFTKKHQALHDIASDSIVVLKSPEKHTEDEKLKENVFQQIGYKYPHIIKRIIVSLLYIFLLNLIVGISLVIFTSESCYADDICNKKEEIIQVVTGVFWIASSIVILIKGLKGTLYGVRRQLIDK